MLYLTAKKGNGHVLIIRIMKKYILGASLFLSSLSSFGAGYQINLEGLRQVAMGGTGTAWPWDASTIFYNPGGLARLKNIQLYVGASVIMPSTGYSNGAVTATSVKQTFTPVNFYVGGPIREGSPWAVGLGVYTPYGTGLQWDNNWIGRYMVRSSQLSCFFVQPTVSYRVGQFLSVGAGFVYANGTLDMTQALPVQNILGSDADSKLHGAGSGVGFNLGVQMKFSDELQMGLTYRSQVNLNIDGGSAHFNVPSSLVSSFPNTSFGTTLPLPQVASFGIGIRPTEFLTIQFDLNYTGWNSLDTLAVNFSQHTSALKDLHAPRMYRNTLTPRLGMCFKICKELSLMGGAAYDPTPVTDGFVSPDLPDADRIVLTCGAAIKPLPRFTILAAFEGTTSVKRNGMYNYGNFAGTYQTTAATPGLAVYYNF